MIGFIALLNIVRQKFTCLEFRVDRDRTEGNTNSHPDFITLILSIILKKLIFSSITIFRRI